MKNFNKLGIYMDLTHALLMELEDNQIISRNIISGLNETDSTDKQENHFLGFEWTEKQHLQKAYFTEISDIIKHYQQVVLFGATDAKDELYKLLEAHYQFNDIRIELANTGKLNEAQMHEFVKEYYN
jgi:ADP-heptose:LPS heptosyltransferase